VSEKAQVFVTGHFEYDACTLAYEYERDTNRGLKPEVPHNYFQDDDPRRDPVVRWRAHSTLLYTNWLNYYVYQRTPYDLDKIDLYIDRSR
jgi:homoserine O-succinyltransferase